MGFLDGLRKTGFGSSNNTLANSISMMYQKQRAQDFNNDLLGHDGYLTFEDMEKISKKHKIPLAKVFTESNVRNQAKLKSRLPQLASQMMKMRSEEEYQGMNGIEKMMKDLGVEPYEIGPLTELMQNTKEEWSTETNVDPYKDVIQTSQSGDVRLVRAGKEKPGDNKKIPLIEEYEYFRGQNPGYKGDIFEYQMMKKGREQELTPSEDAFKNETSLRKDFNAASKDYIQVRDSHYRVEAAGKDPSAAGDLALIFNYMKVLDPGSVVRESEFATAAASGSWGERLKAAGAKLLAGERLSDEMRNDFIKRSKMLYQKQQKTHGRLEAEYKRLGKSYGLNIDNIIVDYVPPEFKDLESEKKRLAKMFGATDKAVASNGSSSLDDFWE